MRTMNCCIFSASWKSFRHRIREKPFFWTTALAFWLFWLWLAGNTPYGVDDWRWGVSVGLEQLRTASLNSRYVGNLMEVIVSRSVVLKTILMGTMEILTPLLSVLLVQRWRETEEEKTSNDRFLAVQVVLANLIWLTIAREVWQQTYGWVAGFSNYGLSALLLVISQGILLDGKNPEKKQDKGFLFLCILVGFISQLTLESLTVFLLALAFISVFSQILFCRHCSSARLAFLFGAILGAAVMFSGNVYSTLLVTGRTEGVGRHLSFSFDMSLPEILHVFYYRFLYFMPGNLWGNNWLACTVIALCMIPASRDFEKPLKIMIMGICCCFSLFFIWNHFWGPLEEQISRWNEFYTQWLHILFFLVVFFFVVCLFRKQKKLRNVLLLLWLLCPLAISPMLTVSDMGGRCFLPPIVFLEEFCLLLFQQEAEKFSPRIRKAGLVAFAAVLLVSAVQMMHIYGCMGEAERQRETRIAEAREIQKTSLYLPDYPYVQYHWITEPLKGGGQISEFREFYQIPDDMELLFDPDED